jgi:hypothetical protein
MVAMLHLFFFQLPVAFLTPVFHFGLGIAMWKALGGVMWKVLGVRQVNGGLECMYRELC